MEKTGRFCFKKVIPALDLRHTEAIEFTKQAMCREFGDKLAAIIIDGRKYSVTQLSLTEDDLGPYSSDVGLMLVCDITLVCAGDAQVGESIHEFPVRVSAGVNLYEWRRAKWERMPWGWKRIK